MVQFKYNDTMKRYDVSVPMRVASISEDNKITIHRELRIDLVRQILMHWDEYGHQTERELEEDK